MEKEEFKQKVAEQMKTVQLELAAASNGHTQALIWVLAELSKEEAPK